MGMDWLKGLVGPTANFDQQGPPQQGGAPYGAPQYGVPPTYGGPQYGGPPQGAPQHGGPQQGAPPPAGHGQPTYGAPPGGAPQPAWNAPAPTYGAAPGAPASPDARVAALEARCAELRHDIESIALFARTLLTLLEERKIVTQDQFQETKRKLDMLDGKLDDRIASS